MLLVIWQSLARTILQAQPNAAHHAFSRLEQMGKLKTVVTQNIDMLHSRAGFTLTVISMLLIVLVMLGVFRWRRWI